ncbi:hypothetical protein HDU80_005311 [Chytriomyces hyalinus]|nr:hypothetical protein HDU80_005311 [Chytriomyces hyalinus]
MRTIPAGYYPASSLPRTATASYTIGIICYRLGLESALGAVKTMMTEHFNAKSSRLRYKKRKKVPDPSTYGTWSPYKDSFPWVGPRANVSLAAYVQSHLECNEEDELAGELGAVMAFLYSSYIMLHFFLNFGLGPHLDEFANKVKGIKDTKNLAYEGQAG